MEPLICFSAVKISTQETSAGENIRFDEEVIDTHDAYNPASGVYVIPQDGVYEAIVTIHQPSGTFYDDTIASLYVDDTFLALLFKHAPGAIGYMTTSIIQEFRAGDALHVVSYDSSYFYGSSDYRATQFSAKYLGPAPSVWYVNICANKCARSATSWVVMRRGIYILHSVKLAKYLCTS